MTTQEAFVPVEHDSVLEMLEAEAIFIMREVAAEFERPALLFSGGKDSIVLLRIAEIAREKTIASIARQAFDRVCLKGRIQFKSLFVFFMFSQLAPQFKVGSGDGNFLKQKMFPFF